VSALYGNCRATPVDAPSMLYVKSISTKRYAITFAYLLLEFPNKTHRFLGSHKTLLGFSDSVVAFLIAV
jgi:hypothetical protein